MTASSTPKPSRQSSSADGDNNNNASATPRSLRSSRSKSPTKAASSSAVVTPSTGSRTAKSRNTATATKTHKVTAAETAISSARTPVGKTKPQLSSTTNGLDNGPDEQPSGTSPTAAAAADKHIKSQTAATLEELQLRVHHAETAAAQYQKQAALLQQRLDDTIRDQSQPRQNSDDTISSSHLARIEALEKAANQSAQDYKQLEIRYNAKVAAAKQDSRAAHEREQTLLQTISSHKIRNDSIQDTTALSVHGTDTNTLAADKDYQIKALRLELADAQVKLIEAENKDLKRIQELENTIVQVKMANVQLMEEHETLGFQGGHKDFGSACFSEKQRAVSASQVAGTFNVLAAELNLAPQNGAVSHQQLQAELTTLRDQNKALTQYLNNIVSRILQHGELDGILDRDPDLMKGSEILLPFNSSDAGTTPLSAIPSDGGASKFMGVLQRTRSMMSTTPRSNPRFQYGQRTDSLISSVHEHPDTAPRVPLSARNTQRPVSIASRRGMSDSLAGPISTSGPALRGRSPSSKTVLSPESLSPLSSTMPPFSSPSKRQPSSTRVPSNSTVPTVDESDERTADASKRDSKIPSSRNSIVSDVASDTSSPPRSNASSSNEKTSGAIMMGSKPRPLRLLREHDEAARKAANRNSWMGWLKGPEKPGP